MLVNEANGITPTSTPASKSTPTSNHRSQGRAGTNKRQAPRTHVSGGQGSTHGMCEVRSPAISSPWSSPLSLSCHTQFCRSKPTYQRSKYCSRTCADRAATTCKVRCFQCSRSWLVRREWPLTFGVVLSNEPEGQGTWSILFANLRRQSAGHINPRECVPHRLDIGFPGLDLCEYSMCRWLVHRCCWLTFSMCPSS
ncbi:hypothetical protein OG21DRAFT_1120093 [Imleria badia]|nr:hypothetical protein OG21DRAFT_1120093 [Imleria badia]